MVNTCQPPHSSGIPKLARELHICYCGRLDLCGGHVFFGLLCCGVASKVGVVEEAVGSTGTDFSVEIFMPKNQRIPLPIMFFIHLKVPSHF